MSIVNLKDFKYTNNKHVNSYRVNCEETPYTRKQLLSELPKYKDFMQNFNCSIDELCDILSLYGITDNDLFEYSIYGTHLIGKDYIYTSKFVPCGWNAFSEEKKYYDLYITCNTYASLALNTAANEIIKRRFPYLTLPPFTKVTKRFNDNIKNLPKTLNAKIESIDKSILFDNDLTIGDLIKLYSDENYADSTIEKPLYAVYSDWGDIFITIDGNKGGWSLYLKYSDLANNDWKAIEERKINSVCLYDENGEQIKGEWFNGKQKDAPYFNHPLVKELKKILLIY